MRVTHFNRDKRDGNYSIEQIFFFLRKELSEKCEVISYDLPPKLNCYQSILWASKRKGTINHITGDVHYLAFGLIPDKTIITVHDIGHFSRTLKNIKKIVYKKLWLDLPFARVKKLIAISDFTKKEIIEKLKVQDSKIEVIPNPILPGISFESLKKDAHKPVIMQIGSAAHKNLNRLISAVVGMDVKLLLINKLFDEESKRMLIDNSIDYEQRTDLSLSDLQKAYSECDIVFFASEYEGFGMPIIEAQAVGRPVITSFFSPMKEIAGDKGAFFVNPYSISDIRQAIQSMLMNKYMYNELIFNGLKNVNKYKLETIAEKYYKIYSDL